MVLLHSSNILLKTKCPDFKLKSVDDQIYTLLSFSKSKALLIAFICNHCPYVRSIEDRLIKLKKLFKEDQFDMVGICSNDAKNYPDDSKENLKKRWQEKNYGFPYLIDEDQSVAKNFKAVCTPEFFLFDENRQLFYHGQIDDNWQNEERVTEHYLQNAIKDIINDRPPPKNQISSMGCSIKWRD